MAEEDLRSHMRLEHVEGSPACPFCDLQDLTREEMVRGMGLTRPQEVHVNCAHLDFLTPESDDMQYLEVRGEVEHRLNR